MARSSLGPGDHRAAATPPFSPMRRREMTTAAGMTRDRTAMTVEARPSRT